MKWYEQMIETAKSFIQDGQSLTPALFLLSHDHKLDIVSLAPFADDKDLMADFIRSVSFPLLKRLSRFCTATERRKSSG